MLINKVKIKNAETFSSTMKVLLSWMLVLILSCGCLTSPANAAVKASKTKDGHVIENAAIKVLLSEQGGRIQQFIDKKTGKNLVQENDGLLDEDGALANWKYKGIIRRPGEHEGRIEFIAELPSGLQISKQITVFDDESTATFLFTVTNNTQEAAQLHLNNHMSFSGSIISPDEKQQAKLKTSSWVAAWDDAAKIGIITAASSSMKIPIDHSGGSLNFAWNYSKIPAGKRISAAARISVIHDDAPHWSDISAAILKGLPRTRLSDIDGWINETERYQITDAEKLHGFWLSTGDDTGKRRVPNPAQIDTPLNEKRSIYIGINALKDLQNATLQISFDGIPQKLMSAAWQIQDDTSIRIIPFDKSTKIQLPSGAAGRLWLTLNGGNTAANAAGNMELSINGAKVLLPLHAKVWDVQIPQNRPFHLRGYGTYPSAFNGNHTITSESLKQVDAYMAAFAAVGGDVYDFTVAWSALDYHIKIKGSDQTVSAWLKENGKIYQNKPLAAWPEIDFSYINPWITLAQKYGLKRAVTFLSADAAANSDVEEEWRLTQLKKYFSAHDFYGFFCKIGDEIGFEKLDNYIHQAKIARQAGWRPFTSVTGSFTATATGINDINPYLDEWHLNNSRTGNFLDLIRTPAKLETHEVEMPQHWRSYANGGAKDTVAQKLFDGIAPYPSADAESVEVFQDGKPLQRGAGTASGNKLHGVYFTGYNDSLYLAPFEGTNANASKITVRYQVRVPDSAGKPLASVDKSDEIWFYGGGSSPYKNSYGYAAGYSLMALYGGYDGFGWYAFHSARQSRIFWYDDAADAVHVSPPYIGLRDGWNDARLLAWLAKDKKISINQFIDTKKDAPLHVERKSYTVGRRDEITNITDPFVLNDARRKMLEMALLHK